MIFTPPAACASRLSCERTIRSILRSGCMRVEVCKPAHKTCFSTSVMQWRRMKDAVHLAELRCGGENHGGCQAGCLIFWKERWLKRVEANAPISLRKPAAPQ